MPREQDGTDADGKLGLRGAFGAVAVAIDTLALAGVLAMRLRRCRGE